MTARLTTVVGAWTGSNGFRLEPSDPLAEFPATANLTVAAGGHLTSFAYTWSHPDDGPQDGLVVFGQGDDGALVAMWADSWHQKPAPMLMTGAVTGGISTLSGDYGGGWGWRIVLEGRDGFLSMRMENVIPAEHATPEEPAGPYPVMVMELTRA